MVANLIVTPAPPLAKAAGRLPCSLPEFLLQHNRSVAAQQNLCRLAGKVNNGLAPGIGAS
jgi:hypothetical protein